jgi:hypothetical protein
VCEKIFCSFTTRHHLHYPFFFFVSLYFPVHQLFTDLSPTGRYTTVGPLALILTISAMKEAIEDFVSFRRCDFLCGLVDFNCDNFLYFLPYLKHGGTLRIDFYVFHFLAQFRFFIEMNFSIFSGALQVRCGDEQSQVRRV